MNAESLILGAVSDGLFVGVSEAGKLFLDGEGYAVEKWVDAFRDNKADVIKYLTGRCISCKTCIHFSAPGLSAGYCGGREDLPRAYGANHPLRKLPEDKGASCQQWRSSK